MVYNKIPLSIVCLNERAENRGGLLLLWSGRPGSNRRSSAWEADVLPLNYARMAVTSDLSPIASAKGEAPYSERRMEPPPGIEPGTYTLRVCCSTSWAKVAYYSLALQSASVINSEETMFMCYNIEYIQSSNYANHCGWMWILIFAFISIIRIIRSFYLHA